MTDDLLTRMRSVVTLASAYKLLEEGADRIRALEAERDAVMALSAQADRHRDELLAENDALRALLLERCPECKGTGLRDSGGTHPWGEPALLPCDHGIDAALKDRHV